METGSERTEDMDPRVALQLLSDLNRGKLVLPDTSYLDSVWKISSFLKSPKLLSNEDHSYPPIYQISHSQIF